MSEKFKVELVTPKGIVLDKEVEEVIAPGIMGEFGVLIGHTPMLTFIKPGILSYLEDDQFTRFVVGSGFCEVLKDTVTVLVDEAYQPRRNRSGRGCARARSSSKAVFGIGCAGRSGRLSESAK